MFCSFNDELAVGIASIRSDELIPPLQRRPDDAIPIAIADEYLRRFSTYVDQRCKHQEFLKSRTRRLRGYLKRTKSLSRRQERLDEIAHLDQKLSMLDFELQLLDNHFWFEALRRIPRLQQAKHPVLTSDWWFYAESEARWRPGDRQIVANSVPQEFVVH